MNATHRSAILCCAAFAFACATRTAPPSHVSARLQVSVNAIGASESLVAPGIPIPLVVRSRAGKVLIATTTDANGIATFEVSWLANDPPAQIEAALPLDAEMLVGTFQSMRPGIQEYCLVLPSRIPLEHCGGEYRIVP